MGGMIRFHNTLGGKVEDFVPIEPGHVKLYTCGPTVYDYPHIGNWRAYVFEDLLKRFLLFRGFKVAHVMNITDVDDKTIRGAQAKGVGLDEYTKPFIEAFGRDRDTLAILPADHYPRATAHIPEMVALDQDSPRKRLRLQEGRLGLFRHRQVPRLRAPVQDQPRGPPAGAPRRRRRV